MKTKSPEADCNWLSGSVRAASISDGQREPPDMTSSYTALAWEALTRLWPGTGNWETNLCEGFRRGKHCIALDPHPRPCSTEFVDARGQAKINVINGTVDVEVQGLPRSQDWDVWVIDNISGENMSVMPESGDAMTRLGSLKHEGKVAKLHVVLDSETTASLDPDIAVVTRSGKNPTGDRTLGGGISLYRSCT